MMQVVTEGGFYLRAGTNACVRRDGTHISIWICMPFNVNTLPEWAVQVLFEGEYYSDMRVLFEEIW